MAREKDSNIYVTLSYPPVGLIGATAHNLYMNGLSVDTGAITLPRHADVEVTLSYRKKGRLQVHRLTARVTGRGERSTDLTFEDFPLESQRAIRELVARQERTGSLEGVA